MSYIVAGTRLVSTDEPCLHLSEVNLQSPGSRGWRRYQILLVMRDDREAEFRRDLGPASAFAASQIRIPGGVRDETTGRFHIEHTVGELIDIADWHRAGIVPEPTPEPSNLAQAYHDTIDTRRRRRRGRAQFGAVGRD